MVYFVVRKEQGFTWSYLLFSFPLYNSKIKIIIMPLFNVLLILVVVGVALWLVNNYIPMDRKIKNILNMVVVIVVVIWLLQAFGLWDYLKNISL